MAAYPFLLRPSGKDYLWGGNRLKDDFAKNIDLTPLAETWECSTHPDGPSFVDSGRFSGQTLSMVLKMHPEYLGTHPCTNGELPILIKFIDAKEDLSVQVHPDDNYAMEHENGQSGKSEMWYVLDAEKDAKLVYGLIHECDRQTIKNAVEDGSIMDYLQKVPVKKNDLFFIEAGTIHAIGAGTLLAEIQENSNLTYRLYDYGRTGKDGRKRRLHIDKALDVANLERMADPGQPQRVLKYRNGEASELLCRCKYFEARRIILNTGKHPVYYKTDEISFRVLLCLEGRGSIQFENEILDFEKGRCIFVPANSVIINIYGRAQFLEVRG
ncbi:MAG: class I mannose-6-phosphate isomerase [Lachnospiraceae bacterium]